MGIEEHIRIPVPESPRERPGIFGLHLYEIAVQIEVAVVAAVAGVVGAGLVGAVPPVLVEQSAHAVNRDDAHHGAVEEVVHPLVIPEDIVGSELASLDAFRLTRMYSIINEHNTLA